MTSIKYFQERKLKDPDFETYLNRMAQVLEQFSSGFTLRPIKVSLVQTGDVNNPPAWSTSNQIFFDSTPIVEFSHRNVASIKGLNMHEIAHILYSPREGSPFMEEITNQNLRHWWNALEDQRIETLLVARYPSIKSWLDFTIQNFLLQNESTYNRQFPLIHGRKYLPVQVRQLVQDVFVDQSSVKPIADLIDEFSRLNINRDWERGVEIVKEYKDLLGNSLPDTLTKHGLAPTNYFPDPKSKSASDKDMDGCIWKVDSVKFDETDMPVDNPIPSSSDADSDSNNDSNDVNTDINGSSDNSNSSETKNTSGGGKGAGADALRELLKEQLQKNIEDVLDTLSDKLREEIDLYYGYSMLPNEDVPEPPMHSFPKQCPDRNYAKGAEEFGYELLRLKSEFEPTWTSNVDSGRLNAFRWEQGCDYDEAFDRWDSGVDNATDLEVVIAVDASGSMEGNTLHMSNTLWSVKTALDRIGARTTVITFSSGSYGTNNKVVYRADERATDMCYKIPASGGTEPLKTFQYVQSVFAKSNRPTKILLTITDGEWEREDATHSDKIIANLREHGVLTALVYLDNVEVSNVNSHNSELVCAVPNAKDLFGLAKALVDASIRRHVLHR